MISLLLTYVMGLALVVIVIKIELLSPKAPEDGCSLILSRYYLYQKCTLLAHVAKFDKFG